MGIKMYGTPPSPPSHSARLMIERKGLDHKMVCRFPPSPDLVVIEITSPVPTESWIRARIDTQVRGVEGAALPDGAQIMRIEAEETFFVEGFECRSRCDPSNWNGRAASRRRRRLPASAVGVVGSRHHGSQQSALLKPSKPAGKKRGSTTFRRQ